MNQPASKGILNTGFPQGCVLSPIFLTVYSNSISCSSEGMTLLKYVDDVALVAHLTGTSAMSEYHQAVNNVAQTFSGKLP